MDSMKSFFRRIRLDGILIASLLIVIGVLFVALPVESSALLCRISGILLVVFGAVSLLVYFIRAYLHDGAELVKGTVLLLSGIFLLVRPERKSSGTRNIPEHLRAPGCCFSVENSYRAATTLAAWRPNVIVRPQARPVMRFGYVMPNIPPVPSPVA